MIQLLVFGQGKGFQKSFKRSFAKTIPAAVRTLLVIMQHPLIKICLKSFQGLIEFSPERNSVKLVLHRTVQSLADTVALWMADLGSAVIDIFNLQIQFILMVFGSLIELCSSICKHS